MKNVILAGNAITARILCSYLAQDRRYHVTGLTVDDEYLQAGGIDGLESISFSKLKQTHGPDQCVVIMAMGYTDINRGRESMFLRLKEAGYRIETYVHPDARVYTEYPLGEGCVILPSAVIEPYVQVGANNMVWANVTLAHHSVVAENCWIASGAVISGQATVKRNCFIGVNATVVNDVTIEEYCIVGAGALVTKNTETASVHLARSAEAHRFPTYDYMKFTRF